MRLYLLGYLFLSPLLKIFIVEKIIKIFIYCFEHKSCSAFFDWGQTRSLHIASIVFTSFTKHLDTKTLYFTNTHALILPAIR